nr:hypothetical protein 3 [bacterium]BDD47213.1 hypothetical protein 6 [bacterium]
MEKLAWHAANLMNVHLKKKVTVKKLLGKDQPQTQIDKHKNFEKLMQQLNKTKKERQT